MTTTANKTMQQVLNGANLNWLPTLLQMMKLGNMLSPVKVSVTGLTAAAAIDITTMTFRDAATISGLDRANMGIALLSDDGRTLTFPTTVTAFVIEYMPRSETALSAVFVQTGL